MAQAVVPVDNTIVCGQALLISPLIQKQAANVVEEFIEFPRDAKYTIIVPVKFQSISDQLVQLQAKAINEHAVSEVEKDTRVHFVWTAKGQTCVLINFRPILRNNFEYSAFLPLSLVERNGLVVAGVCVTSLHRCYGLEDCQKCLSLRLEEELTLFLQTDLNCV